MWLAGPSADDGDEVDEWAAELETGVAGWHRTPAPEPAAAPEPPPAETATYEDMEGRLGAVAAEEGWDEAEVEAVRAYLSRVGPPPGGDAGGDVEPPSPSVEPEARPAPQPATQRPEISLPGGDELADALAGLERDTGEPGATPPPPADVTPAENDGDLDPAPGEPEWLRGRRDAAARAYRRLRRIFPNPE